MFTICETFQKKQRLLIDHEYQYLLNQFKKVQLQSIKECSPLSHHEIWSRELHHADEVKFMVDSFAALGYLVKFISKQSPLDVGMNRKNVYSVTGSVIDSGLDYPDGSIVSPKEYTKQCKAQAKTYLVKKIHETISTAQVYSKITQLSIKLKKSTGSTNLTAELLDYRKKVFSDTIRWINSVTLYNLMIKTPDEVVTEVKNQMEIEKMENRVRFILFSSVVHIARQESPTGPNWRRFPKTALELVKPYVVGPMVKQTS